MRFARAMIVFVLGACASHTTPVVAPRARTETAPLAPKKDDNTYARDVTTERITYVFRASRTANLVYALDCLADLTICSRSAYEEAFKLDAGDREAILAWKVLHTYQQGNITRDEPTPSVLPIWRAETSS